MTSGSLPRRKADSGSTRTVRRDGGGFDSPAAEMLANQIEIASQTAIGLPQTAVDAAIFERPKYSTRQSRNRKQI